MGDGQGSRTGRRGTMTVTGTKAATEGGVMTTRGLVRRTSVKPAPARQVPTRRAVALLSAAVAALLVTGVLLGSGGPRRPRRDQGVEKGVSYSGYWWTSYDGSAARTSLRELRATGATWAMVLVTVYQDDVDSTTISRTEPNTPTDASLTGIIAYAHKIGLKVMLKPQLDLLNDPSHWRGQIGPDFTDADWTAWFASYDEQIVHYAQLATDTGCQQFSVGCELDSTVVHEAAWRQVIADVRAVYKGKLTYADDQISSDPGAVAWWDAVDLIGQDAYPTLTTRLHPTVAQLATGWAHYYRLLCGCTGASTSPSSSPRSACAASSGRPVRPGTGSAGEGRPGRPAALVSGRAQDLCRALLDEGSVHLAVVHRPDRRRSPRRQLHAARQAGRGRAAPVVQAAAAVRDTGGPAPRTAALDAGEL